MFRAPVGEMISDVHVLPDGLYWSTNRYRDGGYTGDELYHLRFDQNSPTALLTSSEISYPWNLVTVDNRFLYLDVAAPRRNTIAIRKVQRQNRSAAQLHVVTLPHNYSTELSELHYDGSQLIFLARLTQSIYQQGNGRIVGHFKKKIWDALMTASLHGTQGGVRTIRKILLYDSETERADEWGLPDDPNGSMGNLLFDANTLYWVDSWHQKLLSMPRTGGRVTELASGEFTSAVLVDDTILAVTQDRNGSLVYEVPTRGGAPKLVGTTKDTLNFMTADTSYVWWVTTNGAPNGFPPTCASSRHSGWSTIRRLSRADGTIQSVLNAPAVTQVIPVRSTLYAVARDCQSNGLLLKYQMNEPSHGQEP
jgi:hypothetical protein